METTNNPRLSEFQKTMQNMIATNDNMYSSTGTLAQLTNRNRTKNYTKEEVTRILKDGNASELQDLSNTYFHIDGFYRRMCLYYATMLKYSGILIPNMIGKKELSNAAVQKRYYKALDFVERLNVPILCGNFAERIMRDGSYYGIIQTIDQEKFAVIDLPAKYCRTNFKDAFGNDILEFHLGYFDSITKDEDRQTILSCYPKDIQRAYRLYHNGKRNGWFMADSSIGICFPLFDGRPPLIHIIPSIIDYEEAVANAQERDKEEIRKILVQKIPHTNTGELVFEPDEAAEMHAGAVSMMKNNPNISVLTTYADVDSIGSDTSDDDDENISKASSSIYERAGLSSELFAATGNLTLDKSIKNDLSFIMPMANKFSLFITNIINRLYKNSQVHFKYKLLPISYYNETDYINDSHKLASSGYSFLLPALAMDLTQKDLINIKDLENEVLELRDKLLPLSTSYTEAAGTEVGRPEKAEGQKSDKTIKNQTSIDNGGEA